MEKKRKAFYDVELNLGFNNSPLNYSIVFLVGLRKTGKTIILKQLSKEHDGYYINFKEVQDTKKALKEALKTDKELLLLDELTYIHEFDLYVHDLEDACRKGKKIILSGSCYWALKDLHLGILGGGRSGMVELFPLCFEEYLFFSNKIKNYDQGYIPTNDDFISYLRLKDLPYGMDFMLDKIYLQGTIEDSNYASFNKSYHFAYTQIKEVNVLDVLNVIAYTLNMRISMKSFTGTKEIGLQEFGINNYDNYTSLMHRSNTAISNMDFKLIGDILSYLLENGFCFIDNIKDNNAISISSVMQYLKNVRNFKDLELIMNEYTISAVSPLLYTRLLIDIETHLGEFYTNKHLTGVMYELAIKLEDLSAKGFYKLHFSDKIRIDDKEVDLFTSYKSAYLLLEATIRHKSDNRHNVNKVLKDKELIRVLTDKEDKEYEFNGVYHRIPYPQALLMLSNKTIFNLEPTKIGESNGLDIF